MLDLNIMPMESLFDQADPDGVGLGSNLWLFDFYTNSVVVKIQILDEYMYSGDTMENEHLDLCRQLAGGC